MRSKKNPLVMPVVKWVGGKRQLLTDLMPLMPEKITSYCEPFVGGGAVLFSLCPSKAYINDINEELIHVYEVIRDNVDELISVLREHKNEKDHFYEVRDWDRDHEKYQQLDKIQKAARIIYLNKTCYNGLFRVNSAGEFNSPFGNYKNPMIADEPKLLAVSKYLQNPKIELTHGDFSDVLERIGKSTFVYLDPPYDPISDTSSFTGYDRGGFNKDEQIRLRECCDELDRRGIKFMLSNSNTDFIREQYGDRSKYNIIVVKAKRAINSDGAKRGQVDEVVIRNYGG